MYFRPYLVLTCIHVCKVSQAELQAKNTETVTKLLAGFLSLRQKEVP